MSAECVFLIFLYYSLIASMLIRRAGECRLCIPYYSIIARRSCTY